MAEEKKPPHVEQAYNELANAERTGNDERARAARKVLAAAGVSDREIAAVRRRAAASEPADTDADAAAKADADAAAAKAKADADAAAAAVKADTSPAKAKTTTPPVGRTTKPQQTT